MSRQATVFAALTLTVLAACGPRSADLSRDETVPVTATPVLLDPADTARRSVGDLSYLWGVQLAAAPGSRFGSLSGLRLTPTRDGSRLTAVSDDGDLIGLSFGEGPPQGTLAARIARLHDQNGRPLRDKVHADSEGYSRGRGGAFVSFERDDRVLFYPGGGARPMRVGTPKVSLVYNQGFEAVAWLEREQRLAVGAEDGRIWLCSGATFGDCRQIHGRGGPGKRYMLTDLDEVPGRPEMIATYRVFSRKHMRAIIARVRLPADGERAARVTVLAELQAPLTVENVEGVSVGPAGPDGAYPIFLVSDDNFDAGERTLLLAFGWKPRGRAPKEDGSIHVESGGP